MEIDYVLKQKILLPNIIASEILIEKQDIRLTQSQTDNIFSITGPDTGFISFDVDKSWSTGSFKSEALAVQKVGDEYKLAIRESSKSGLRIKI